VLRVAIACESAATVWMGALHRLQLVYSEKWSTRSRCHLRWWVTVPIQPCIALGQDLHARKGNFFGKRMAAQCNVKGKCTQVTHLPKLLWDFLLLISCYSYHFLIILVIITYDISQLTSPPIATVILRPPLTLFPEDGTQPLQLFPFCLLTTTRGHH